MALVGAALGDVTAAGAVTAAIQALAGTLGQGPFGLPPDDALCAHAAEHDRGARSSAAG